MYCFIYLSMHTLGHKPLGRIYCDKIYMYGPLNCVLYLLLKTLD